MVAEEIKKLLISRHQTLSTAESCTSGLIAAALTSVSGASEYFQGGLIAYQDNVKIKELGVSERCIEEHDVVSRHVVEQMVRGACRKFGTDYAIASTGYADKGNDRIPGGTIWIGWGSAEDVHSKCLLLHGSRSENTSRAVEEALNAFHESLANQYTRQ